MPGKRVRRGWVKRLDLRHSAEIDGDLGIQLDLTMKNSDIVDVFLGYYLSGLHNGLCNGIFMDILEKSSKTGEISWGYTLKITQPTWYDFWVCLKMRYTHEMVILWETWWTGGFFFWVSFFAKNLSSHDPTYWFQIVKKGDWLVLGVVEPGLWLAVPTVWSHHVYLSLFRDGCDSDTWPIWIRVGPKFCARLLQLPGIFRMWCWSPVSATAMVLSTLPESKTQMAQIATVRWKCWAKGEPLPWLRLRLGTCWGCTRHRRPTKKSCRIYGKMSLGWQTRGELFDHLWESEINFLATPK